ncbi:mitochondrial import receptor subunit TOM70 [Copidosoma floridanum]|uniref:mitochondrial import receptor subunit TOM70 n=1 Tax=Copidosoma floridanum TaxID=29053 RepID=UPI0006C97C8F|nr:mitochondrial import receptor subunit TOM70 [Copidosoma floridanum]
MSSYTGNSSSLSKWQLALVVGAPVAFGLGYLCYRNYVNDKPKDEEHAKALKRNNVFSSSVDGDDEKSSSIAKPTVAEKPTARSDVFKTEGNKLFQSGKFDEAIEQYNQAIEACPPECIEELATYYQNRAAAYEKLQKYSSVKADCNKALELKPKYVKALVRRAKALEHFDDLVTALEDISAACILERFGNPTTVGMADKILRALGAKHTEEYVKTRKPVMPSKYFIRTYFSAFQHDPITSAINEQSNKEDLTSYEEALKAVKNQNYDDVIPLCTKALNNLEAENDSIHKLKILLLRGTFNLLLGMYEDALSDLSSVINSDVTSKELKVNALIKRASMHVQLEQPEKSFDDFAQAVELDPDCSDIYHNRGQVNLLSEKIEEAKADFDKAVELNPDFGVAFVQKCYTDYRNSVTLRDINMIQESIENFNNACTKFPDCAECFNLYAQVLADTNDFPKADMYFEKAANKDPKNATILVQRGLLHLQWKNDFNLAINLIKKAIEIDDKCEFAYETLGTIEVQRGNLEYAIELFEKALALGRTNMELSHLFSLRDASKAQLSVGLRLGVDLKSTLDTRGFMA